MARRPARPRKTPRYLKAVKRADGILYRWEPGPHLRNAGWAGMDLGYDRAAAMNMADAQNESVDAWRAGAKRPDNVAPARPRHATFGDICAAYRASWAQRETPLATKTRGEYGRYMDQLESWMAASTRLNQIGREDVEYFRDCLLGRIAGVPGVGIPTATAMLRVLSALFTFAEDQRLMARGSNPASRLKIPTAKSRRRRIDRTAADFLVATAEGMGLHNEALAIGLGFYTIQRPADLLSLTETGWREALAIADHDRPMLAGNDGRVMTIRLRQQKTGEWVSCPVPPAYQKRIDQAFAKTRAARQPGDNRPVFLLNDARKDDQFNDRTFRRRWRSIVNQARTNAAQAGDRDMVDELDGIQFRDLRRSGACWMRARRATVAQIAARGGWQIDYCTKILETYMPADEESSGAALALALAADAKAEKRNQAARRRAQSRTADL